MNDTSIRLLSIWVVLLLLSGCSSTSVKDLGLVNHPAMMFDREWMPNPPSSKSSLGNYNDTSGGGGCTTCAH